MSREGQLLKNTVILSIGRFLPKLVSLITLPILTACLTKAEYGTYDLVYTLISLVLPIATLQIQSAAFRFLIDARGDRTQSSSIITNIFAVTLPVSAACSFIMQFFFRQFPVSIRTCISLWFFADTIQATMGQIIRGLGHNREYSVSAVLLSVVDMIGIVLGVRLAGKGLFGLMTAVIAGNCVCILYRMLRIRVLQYIDFRTVSGKQIKTLLAYSWPMVPNNLSTWVLKLSDRLVITSFLGAEANAVYAVANKVPNLLAMAQTVMVMAWQENASIAARDKDATEYYSKMSVASFDLMFSLTALLIAATPIMFALLIRGDYGEAYYQMPLLILAMFFFVMSSFFGGIYIAHKKTLNVGVSTVLAAAINLAIDLLFVKHIGITAGSVSTLVAYMVLYYYRMINVQKFQKVHCDLKRQFAQLLILVAMLTMCFFQKTVLNVVNIVLGIGVAWFFNREKLMSLLRKAKRTAR